MELNQIKSWQISLAGFLLYFIPLLLNAVFARGHDPMGLLIEVFLLVCLLAFIPARLLYLEKTRKVGAILSIILGVVFTMTGIFSILGILDILAGLWYFWKKQ